MVHEFLSITFFRVINASATVSCNDGTTQLTCDTGLPHTNASTSQLQEILTIVFGVLTAVAVLMIVIAGLRFITAQGNPQEVAKARQTILYSVAGLIIALTAEVIVAFVLGKA